jgi:putative transposase
MRFTSIEQHAATYPVRVMCRMLGVSPSGYYGWRGRPPSARTMPVLSEVEGANVTLLGDVRRILTRHQGRYGSPRMHAAPRAEGRGCSRGRVERLMRRHGIRALAGRRFRPCTTDSQQQPSLTLASPRLSNRCSTEAVSFPVARPPFKYLCVQRIFQANARSSDTHIALFHHPKVNPALTQYRIHGS